MEKIELAANGLLGPSHAADADDILTGLHDGTAGPVNILIVDDEPRNLTVIETILDQPDYRLVRAASPDDALLALLADEFALLILDVRLPGMTGFELAQIVRGRRKNADVPIIFLTAYYRDDLHVLEGYDAGAVDYLYKPINSAILRSKVRVFVELYRRQRHAEEVNRTLAAEVKSRCRAEGELRELNNVLEQRVVERTASLKSSTRRLRAVYDGTSEYMWLLAPDGTVIEANRSALDIAGGELAGIAGRPLSQTPWFAFTPGAKEAVANAVARAAAGAPRRFEMTISTATGESKTLDISFLPLYDEAGDFVLIFSAALDVTARVAAEHAVRDSERRFRDMIAGLPAAVYTTDRDGVLTHYNPACLTICGRIPVLGVDRWSVAWRLYHPDGTAMGHDDCAMAEALAAGTSRRVKEAIIERPDGTRIFVTDHAIVVRDDDGRIVGGLNMIADVTERRRSEAHIRKLLDEVDHRSKNILSVVQAIARQTAVASPDAFVARFSERIQHLAVSHDLLVKSRWRGIDLIELVQAQLRPFRGLIGERIMLAGASFMLTVAATQTLGIILHELATNATKYGALSTSSGEVEISWQAEQAGGAEVFAISWVESRGPEVTAPDRRGFGSIVMKEMAETSLDGDVDLQFLPTGLSWRLRCPAGKVLESAASRGRA